LVDGSSPELAETRTKRLRALGNAIVLPQATSFIACAREAFGDVVNWARTEEAAQ
jgi:hypothetical protein